MTKLQLVRVISPERQRFSIDERVSDLLDRVESDFRSALLVTRTLDVCIEVSVLFRSHCPYEIISHLHMETASTHDMKIADCHPDVHSFFQVNAERYPLLERATEKVRDHCFPIFKDIMQRILKPHDKTCSIELFLTFKRSRLHSRKEVFNTLCPDER